MSALKGKGQPLAPEFRVLGIDPGITNTGYGLVVEVIEGRTGTTERVVVAPEMSSERGDDRSAALYGDLLAIHGSYDNTVVYRVTDGARLMAFFGRPIAGDAGLGLIAATNNPQEVTIYEVATGKVMGQVTLDHNALAARFIPEKRQLLVLTSTQRVYALDLPAAGPTRHAGRLGNQICV